MVSVWRLKIISMYPLVIGISDSQYVQGLDPDVQAYINAVNTAGGSLTATETNAVSTLVSDLKAANIWSKLDIFLPVLGTDPEAMVINLVDPTNINANWTWTYFGSPTLSSTGIKGNGTNAAVLSDWTLTEDLVKSQVNDSHWSCYIKYFGSNPSGVYANGVLDTSSTPYAKIGYGSFGNAAYGGMYNDAYAFAGGPGDTAFDGFIYGQGIAANTSELFINDVSQGVRNVYTRAMGANQKIAMLALAWTTQPNGIYPDLNNGEIRSWSMGSSLTSGERSSYYTAVQTFQTTLGRQV